MHDSHAPHEGSNFIRASHRAAKRRANLKSFLLVLPLLLATLVFFVLPIGSMLSNSFIDDAVRVSLPNTVKEIADWNMHGLPNDSAFSALLTDLHAVDSNGNPGALAQRLDAEISGYKNIIFKTLLKLPDEPSGSAKQTLIDIDKAWGTPLYWKAIKHASGYMTSDYLLSALDFRYDLNEGKITGVSPDQAIFQMIFIRTFNISAIITLLCLALGYPLAYWLAKLPTHKSNMLMIFVLLPFWTSTVVRTAAWIVLLQTDGVVSRLLQIIGFATPHTQLSFNQLGLIVAMTHILLPFMVLPLYSIMKGIPDSYVKAAISLGAHPFIAFLRIYVPQTAAGLASGCLLTFILAIGYYVIPVLIGGAADQMISYFIAFYTRETNNWGLASALGSILLIVILLLYPIYGKLTTLKSAEQES